MFETTNQSLSWQHDQQYTDNLWQRCVTQRTEGVCWIHLKHQRLGLSLGITIRGRLSIYSRTSTQYHQHSHLHPNVVCLTWSNYSFTQSAHYEQGHTPPKRKRWESKDILQEFKSLAVRMAEFFQMPTRLRVGSTRSWLKPVVALSSSRFRHVQRRFVAFWNAKSEDVGSIWEVWPCVIQIFGNNVPHYVGKATITFC